MIALHFYKWLFNRNWNQLFIICEKICCCETMITESNIKTLICYWYWKVYCSQSTINWYIMNIRWYFPSSQLIWYIFFVIKFFIVTKDSYSVNFCLELVDFLLCQKYFTWQRVITATVDYLYMWFDCFRLIL